MFQQYSKIYTHGLHLCWLLLALCVFASCKKNPEDTPENTLETIFENSELPYFKVTTTSPIQNEPKIPATLEILNAGEHNLTTNIGIEYRGSTSYRLSDKKSFGVETWDEAGEDQNVALLGFPKEEDWIFMGHVFRASTNTIFDPSLMFHFLGYELSRSVGRYASRTKFIELEVNGDYLGAYVFMEKLKRDKNRINIKKLDDDDNAPDKISGGYILKIDKTAGGDVAQDQPLPYYENNWEDDARYTAALGFRSHYDIFGQQIDFPPFGPPYHDRQYLETYFLYEYPKADNISPQQQVYIQNYIYDFETALLSDDFSLPTRSYTQYIDVDSFADYFILNELVGNVDAYRLSTYLQKNRDGKLQMGPLWDLNIGYGKQNRVPQDDWIINYNRHVSKDAWMVHFWWPRLLEDPQFKAVVKARWENYRQGPLSEVVILNKVDETANLLLSNGAIDRNYGRWTGINVDYLSAINDLKTYLSTRLNWMDQTIGGF